MSAEDRREPNDLEVMIARVLYGWMPIVGAGGRGEVSFDSAREYHADFIDKHFDEAREIVDAIIAWQPTSAMIEAAGDLHGATPWSASDDSVYTSMFRAMLNASRALPNVPREADPPQADGTKDSEATSNA